jgi:hypothetical protein
MQDKKAANLIAYPSAGNLAKSLKLVSIGLKVER